MDSRNRSFSSKAGLHGGVRFLAIITTILALITVRVHGVHNGEMARRAAPLIRRHSIFNEGIDTGPGSMRGRWIPDRVTSSAPAIEVGDHLIFKWYARVRVKWGVFWAPSDTVGAYSGGAIGGYCPAELIPVRRPSSSDLPVQDPIFYFHGKMFDRRKSRAAIWVFVLVVIHCNPPVSIESRISHRVLRDERHGQDRNHNCNQRSRFHKDCEPS